MLVEEIRDEKEEEEYIQICPECKVGRMILKEVYRSRDISSMINTS